MDAVMIDVRRVVGRENNNSQTTSLLLLFACHGNVGCVCGGQKKYCLAWRKTEKGGGTCLVWSRRDRLVVLFRG